MPRALTALALAAAIAAPAWGQTTWAADRFTVSTANTTAFDVVDGSVRLRELPRAYSDAGTAPGLIDDFFNLTFAPRGANVLVGERVTYTVDLSLDEYDGPTDWLYKPTGRFTMEIDGVPPTSRSIDGGTLHFRGGAFIASPTFDAHPSVYANAGIVCPAGHVANDCDFGTDVIFLNALVQFSSITVTPVLTAVPEPRTAWLWLMGLAACLARATPPGRALKPLPARRSSRPDDPPVA